MGFYDQQIKSLCDRCPRLVIMATNSIFRMNHSLNSEVIYLNKEQSAVNATYMDLYFEINLERYHWEFQLLDGNIAIRMYEYGMKSTFVSWNNSSNCNNKRARDYSIEMILPEQAVVFLAGNNKEDRITINMVLPNKQRVTYTLPCIDASQSLEELVRKELFLLIPFQQVQFNDRMNHISDKSKSTKHKISQQIFEYHIKVRDVLEKLKSDGILTLVEYECLMDSFSSVENYLIEKDEEIHEEVAIMGDEDYISWTDRNEARGFERGVEAGKKDLIISLVNQGDISLKVGAERLGVSEAELSELIKN